MIAPRWACGRRPRDQGPVIHRTCSSVYRGLTDVLLRGEPVARSGEPVGGGRPPAAGLVRLRRRLAAEGEIDDAPCLFHGVLAGEVAGVAGECAGQDPLVGALRL